MSERNAIFDFIRDNNIGGVLLLSGDTHVGELNVIPWSENGGCDFYEKVITNVNYGLDNYFANCAGLGEYAIPRPVFLPTNECFFPALDSCGLVFLPKLGRAGSNRINLSNNEYGECEPSFSPDGSKILFISSRDGTRSVCLMNADGSNQIKLTETSGDDSHPVFSPDGSTIFFISSVRSMRYRDIVTKDIATGEIRNLTKALNDANQNISFSGDGKRLVFESLDSANSEDT